MTAKCGVCGYPKDDYNHHQPDSHDFTPAAEDRDKGREERLLECAADIAYAAYGHDQDSGDAVLSILRAHDDAVRAEVACAPHQHNISVCGECIELENLGARVATQKLLAIAYTGEHTGAFGGPELEAAAQAISDLHRRNREAMLAAEHMCDEMERWCQYAADKDEALERGDRAEWAANDARAILDKIHEAFGEAPESDDTELPQMVKTLRETIAALDIRCADAEAGKRETEEQAVKCMSDCEGYQLEANRRRRERDVLNAKVAELETRLVACIQENQRLDFGQVGLLAQLAEKDKALLEALDMSAGLLDALISEHLHPCPVKLCDFRELVAGARDFLSTTLSTTKLNTEESSR